MAKFGKPSKINLVSVTIYLAIAAAIYWAVLFGPAYIRKYRVSGVLSESANIVYPQRNLLSAIGSDFADKVKTDTMTKLRAVGVLDPELAIFIEVSETDVKVTARYQEIIKHPLIKKTTTLEFSPFYSVAITPTTN